MLDLRDKHAGGDPCIGDVGLQVVVSLELQGLRHSGRKIAHDLPLDVQGMALDPLPFVHVVEELLGVQLEEEWGDWVRESNRSSVKHNN